MDGGSSIIGALIFATFITTTIVLLCEAADLEAFRPIVWANYANWIMIYITMAVLLYRYLW